jgi:tight adherence protein B
MAAAVGGLTGLVVGGAALAVIGSAAAATALAGHTRATTARRQAEHDAAVTEACVMLAAELRAGAHPRQALSVVAAQWPALFGRAARQAAEVGEVGPALRAAAGERSSALSAVAAGWEVSERTGAVLSDVLTAIAHSLRADAAARREAMAQLSTVRVTARLLAVLPVGTLLLLSGGGGAALQFLLRSPYGQGCLVGAALLTAAGLWWVDRLAGSATER